MKVSTLRIIFSLFLVAIIIATIWASFEEGVYQGTLHVTQFRWGWATLVDTYLAFTTFFVLIVFREKGILRKLMWFIAIYLLGNMAMAAYVLLQLRGKDGNEVIQLGLLK